ncbi:MAG TPA: translational GTPase TypA [Bacillota bacterium]|nr:translational GTPase TypA [Bacillota bacterium]HPP60885.1 translational GTPase TypA [Bacillota bacterium]HPZ78265.1 translational GTPase TypA [Bacillota bacterium]HQD74414.1 translational GTPase TypA [Bacillota bacterium]
MDIRNVAVIAHVDHGKTTLVDALLRQTGVFRSNQVVQDRILDSGDLERERGITILAKNTSIMYKGVKINIVDTPGHSDFGGEVERILGMVDGGLLLVDACDGPMPQTRFVVQKALERGLKLVLVINKIDRPDQRINEVYEEVFDLLVNLGAQDDDVDFPVVYTDAKRGFATMDPKVAKEYPKLISKPGLPCDISPVLDAIISRIPPPRVDAHKGLQMMVSAVVHDDYLGRIGIGKVSAGTLKRGDRVCVCKADGTEQVAEIGTLWVFQGLTRTEVLQVDAGDIALVSKIDDIDIGDTIADPNDPVSIPRVRVEEPTIVVNFRVNDSPFAGTEGQYVTSRHLGERLLREAKKDVSLKVESTSEPDCFRVSGRGDLHLSVLMETMRREGYEMAVSRPEVILRVENGKPREPFEYLTIDVPEMYMGSVMEELGPRKAEFVDMHQEGDGRVRLNFLIPTRGIFGLRQALLTLTKGTSIMHHVFDTYGEYAGDIAVRRSGAMIAWETGMVTAYAVKNAEERGCLFVSPGDRVYAGQVVGEHCRSMDLDINLCKKRHLSNVRAAASEELVKLSPPRKMSLEEALIWIKEDELLEVTPKSVRIRKAILDRQDRYRARTSHPMSEAGPGD